MFDIQKKKEKANLAFENAIIEDLLSEDKRWHHYKYSFEQTKSVLKRCTSVMHLAILHRWAFLGQQNHHEDFPMVRQETLDLIYHDLTLALTKFLNNFPDIYTLAELYEFLGEVRYDRDNSPGRRMLQSRVEVVWRARVADMLVELRNNPQTVQVEYEELFKICKEDDPNILEIAKEINKLASKF